MNFAFIEQNFAMENIELLPKGIPRCMYRNLTLQRIYSQFETFISFSPIQITIKLSMIIACVVGFWYFHVIPSTPEHAPMLDVVLLIMCLVSPLCLDIFSLLGVFGSKITEFNIRIVTRITLPVCDILQQTLQVCYITLAQLFKATDGGGHYVEATCHLLAIIKLHCNRTVPYFVSY